MGVKRAVRAASNTGGAGLRAAAPRAAGFALAAGANVAGNGVTVCLFMLKKKENFPVYDKKLAAILDKEEGTATIKIDTAQLQLILNDIQILQSRVADVKMCFDWVKAHQEKIIKSDDPNSPTAEDIQESIRLRVQLYESLARLFAD
jgi:hypothetical protein